MAELKADVLPAAEDEFRSFLGAGRAMAFAAGELLRWVYQLAGQGGHGLRPARLVRSTGLYVHHGHRLLGFVAVSGRRLVLLHVRQNGSARALEEGLDEALTRLEEWMNEQD